MTTIDATLDGLLHDLQRMIGAVDDWHAATPCAEWDAGALVDHLVVDLRNFAAGMRGEEVDWAAATATNDDRAAAFAEAADDLRAAYADGLDAQVDWQLGELATHAWDLAAATGTSTSDLDPAAAERGLAFVSANLTDERRGSAFAPAVEPAADADAYGRLAAFAGRSA
ncbi:TIGR03086 family metal-binding protein [Agrococcus jejuensis]|uniref:TIGR03086 family protein n=1 Tax=Agrococcus jejuensis TaxID=399736 RepID=A0A1G8GK35_9MICO|nr:TIGR03086 family metal-binding protein [Agrococcus jejuensis]SDH94775.1 TIGR03086 family protein [Agrococcus jejuensis]